MFKKAFFTLLIAAGISLGGLTTVEAAPLITLERAKTMALEQGTQLQTTRLAHSQAEVSLDRLRSQHGLGSYFTPERLKEEVDQLGALIDERVKAIGLLEQSIAAWEKELAALAAGNPAAGELQKNIDQAYRDIAKYNQQLGELRPAYASMVVRYHEQKSREDQVKPQLRPAQSALASAQVALAIQPMVIGYGVEQSYLTLLAMARQIAHQESAVQNLERMLGMEQKLWELGRSSALRVDQAEERLRQGRQSALSLKQQQENLRRTFRRQLGLPEGFAFSLAEVTLNMPEEHAAVEQMAQTGQKAPDLTATLTYRRNLEELEQRKRDLADTPKGDRNQFRGAELAVTEAELNLENSLSALTKNYLARAEALELAAESLRNSEFGRQNSSRSLAKARLQYKLGLISLLELEQQEISFKEADLRLYSARQQYHLALRAYQLSREGINPDTAS